MGAYKKAVITDAGRAWWPGRGRGNGNPVFPCQYIRVRLPGWYEIRGDREAGGDPADGASSRRAGGGWDTGECEGHVWQ